MPTERIPNHGLYKKMAGLPLPPVLLMYLLRAKTHPDHLPAAPALHLKHRLARWHLINVKDMPPAFRVRASNSLNNDLLLSESDSV